MDTEEQENPGTHRDTSSNEDIRKDNSLQSPETPTQNSVEQNSSREEEREEAEPVSNPARADEPIHTDNKNQSMTEKHELSNPFQAKGNELEISVNIEVDSALSNGDDKNDEQNLKPEDIVDSSTDTTSKTINSAGRVINNENENSMDALIIENAHKCQGGEEEETDCSESKSMHQNEERKSEGEDEQGIDKNISNENKSKDDTSNDKENKSDDGDENDEKEEEEGSEDGNEKFKMAEKKIIDKRKNKHFVECEGCFDNNDAFWYCHRCEGNLCRKCYRHHSRRRISRRHPLTLIDRPDGCKEHPGNKLWFKCKDCDNKECCGWCKLKFHVGHKVIGATQKEITPQMELIPFDLLTTILERTELEMETVDCQIDILGEEMYTIQTDMKDVIEKLNTTIDIVYDRMIGKVEEKFRARRGLLVPDYRSLENQRIMIERTINDCRERLNQPRLGTRDLIKALGINIPNIEEYISNVPPPRIN